MEISKIKQAEIFSLFLFILQSENFLAPVVKFIFFLQKQFIDSLKFSTALPRFRQRQKSPPGTYRLMSRGLSILYYLY